MACHKPLGADDSLALLYFLLYVPDHHILLHMDNMAVVEYLIHQGGVQSCALQRLVEYRLSRGGVAHGEWRLHLYSSSLLT